MSKITDEEILKIANLARIKINSDDVKKFRDSIEEILEYVDNLSEVDTSNVDPFFSLNDLSNSFREDDPRKNTDFTTNYDNFISLKNGYIKVNKVL